MVRYSQEEISRGRKYVRDNRGKKPAGKAVAGGGGILILILSLIFGSDVLGSIDGTTNSAFTTDSGQEVSIEPENDDEIDTVNLMYGTMGNLNEFWQQEYPEAFGEPYTDVELIMFRGSTKTGGCGNATSAVGPFYCPAPQDLSAYVDLAFFSQLGGELGAKGDFAQAYVIAHEVGHHIQAISGISERIRELQNDNPANKNAYGITAETMADCFAGIWTKAASEQTTSDGEARLEVGDVQEAFKAADSVGDDNLGAARENWTHGSGDQRKEAFDLGLQQGSVRECVDWASQQS